MTSPTPRRGWVIALVMWLLAPSGARAQDCPTREPLAVLRVPLQAAPKEILGPDPARAMRMLETTFEQLPCASEVVPTADLARLLYLRGMALLYTLDLQDELDTDGRARVREAFLAALAADPTLSWDGTLFADYGEDIFLAALGVDRSVSAVEVTIPSPRPLPLFVDGADASTRATVTLKPGRHFVQAGSDEHLRGVWFTVTPGALGLNLSFPPGVPMGETRKTQPSEDWDEPSPERGGLSLGSSVALMHLPAMSYLGPSARASYALPADLRAGLEVGALLGPLDACQSCITDQGMKVLIDVHPVIGWAKAAAPGWTVMPGLGAHVLIGGFAALDPAGEPTTSALALAPGVLLEVLKELGAWEVGVRTGGGPLLTAGSVVGTQWSAGLSISQRGGSR